MNDRDMWGAFGALGKNRDAFCLRYPASLIGTLVERTGLAVGGRVLEIGCWTGGLRLPLMQRGLHVTAIDLGEAMRRIAEPKSTPHDSAAAVAADFETLDVEEGAYDVVAATRPFRWISPDIAYPASRRALRAGGFLALIRNLHPRANSSTSPLLAEALGHRAPVMPTAKPWSPDEEIEKMRHELAATGLFSEPEVFLFPWSILHIVEEVVRFQRALSDHLALAPSVCRRLLASAREAIDGNGGQIDRPLVSTLILSRRQG